MIKWFLYIVLLMIATPRLSYAKKATLYNNFFNSTHVSLSNTYALQRDTAALKNARQRQAEEEKKKIKEVARAKKMPKPEKIEPVDTKPKPKRQRRPDGLERPPEIPRRND